MTDTHPEDMPEAESKPVSQQPVFSTGQSPFYLKAKLSWHQRWQSVIEQCSDCFIRF